MCEGFVLIDEQGHETFGQTQGELSAALGVALEALPRFASGPLAESSMAKLYLVDVEALGRRTGYEVTPPWREPYAGRWALFVRDQRQYELF